MIVLSARHYSSVSMCLLRISTTPYLWQVSLATAQMICL